MLDIKFIEEHSDLVKENSQKRRVDVDIDRLLAVNILRRENLQNLEALRAERNKKSKGKPSSEEIVKMRGVGEEIKVLEEKQSKIEGEFYELLKRIPNMTHSDVPVGGEDDYRVLFTNKNPPQFSFTPKDHEALLEERDLIDFERGAKVAGARFYFLKGDMVRLNFALLQYGMDTLQKHGFTIVETPDLAKNEILEGIGYQPRGPETQVYSIEGTGLSLIGTAEITMGGYHADEILDLSEGPKKYAALSHCFRTEAGAYGRTSKGLYRVHQFTKLEMFIYCQPEESDRLHEELLRIEQEIADGLGLAYRIIDTASGDLGGPAYRKYDLEAWMAMNDGYGEITSTSNCTDYQARRLNIRYKRDDGATEFVHTLNGTAIVLSRFPLAIVEQYQQADGRIQVPEVLQKYINKKMI